MDYNDDYDDDDDAAPYNIAITTTTSVVSLEFERIEVVVGASRLVNDRRVL